MEHEPCKCIFFNLANVTEEFMYIKTEIAKFQPCDLSVILINLIIKTITYRAQVNRIKKVLSSDFTT